MDIIRISQQKSPFPLCFQPFRKARKKKGIPIAGTPLPSLYKQTLNLKAGIIG